MIGTINIFRTEVTIALERNPHAAAFFVPERKEWSSNVRTQLLRNKRVTIPFFIQQNPISFEISKIEIKSLPEFFKHLANPSLEPVTLITSLNPAEVELDKETESAIIELGRELLACQKELMQNLIGPDSLGAKQLLEQIRIIAELLVAQNWKLVPLAKIDTVISGANPEWEFMFNSQFSSTRKMLSTLFFIRSTLSKIKL